MSPSPEHEGLHRIFGEDQTLLARVLTHLVGHPVPPLAGLSELTIDMTDFQSVLERRSDTVLLAQLSEVRPEDNHAVVIESQTKPEPSRLDAWPYHVAYLRTKYKTKVTLLVVTSRADTARWARQPIRTYGIAGELTQVTIPLVIGPDNMPVILSVEEAAADLGFAVLAALTHSHHPQVREILEALATALETDTDNASNLSEYTEAALGTTPGADIWRSLMASGTFTYVSETRAKGQAERGAADTLRVLERRGIAVDDTSRARIESCTDLATLDIWFDRSFDVKTVEELFND